jgi:hypothetical protein
MKLISIAVFVLFALLGATLASADNGDVDGVNLLPKAQVRNYHGIPFISGGIAEDLEGMKKVAKTYPLRMVFSEEGAYIAEVTVGIYDSYGALVFYNQKSGPYLYVKLPDGEYSIVAIAEGVKRSQKVSLDSTKSKKVFFSWPAKNSDAIEMQDAQPMDDALTP